MLEATVQHIPEQVEVQELLEQAKAGTIPEIQRLRVLSTRPSARLSVSANGRIVFTTGPENTVQVWNSENGLCLQSLHGHTGSVNDVCISADGRVGLSSSRDGTVRVWDLPQGRCVHVFCHAVRVKLARLSLDGKCGISVGVDDTTYTLHLWDVERGKSVALFEIPEVDDLSVNGDGQYAVTANSFGTIQIWDVARRYCLRSLEGHADVGPFSILRVVISADGTSVLSGVQDGVVRVWDVSTGHCVRELRGHSAPIETLSLSADGRLTLSSARDKTVRLWDIEHGMCLRTFLDADFQALLVRLQQGGYGWLSPQRVHARLQDMSTSWRGLRLPE